MALQQVAPFAAVAGAPEDCVLRSSKVITRGVKGFTGMTPVALTSNFASDGTAQSSEFRSGLLRKGVRLFAISKARTPLWAKVYSAMAVKSMDAECPLW